MDKKYFYERLKRWPHLHFSDVIVRESPGTTAWNKRYEIYLKDKARFSAQLFICTTVQSEDPEQVAGQYRDWLEEYNLMAADSPLAGQDQMVHLGKNHRRASSVRFSV